MKLSIIVPVYNVEAYLPECLESCVRQDMTPIEYEIIVVNDGSQDNSSRIISDYSRKYSNIIVVNKENGGLSSARNTGIKRARGEYLWFVDSDDWIEENCLCSLQAKLDTTADIVTLNAILHIGETEKRIIRDLSPSQLYAGKEIYRKSYIFPYSGAPFYVIRKDFLLANDLFFHEGIYYEDLLFTSEMLCLAKSCAVHDKPCYYYRIRENSITTSEISEKKIRDMLLVMDTQYAWLQSCPSVAPEVMADAVCKTANAIVRKFIMRLPQVEKKRWVSELNSRKYWASCLRLANGYKNFIYYVWASLMGAFSF